VTNLPKRILALVTDVNRAGGERSLLRIIDEAVRGGVNFVEVRDHALPDSELVAFARKIVEIVASRAIVVANGPAEIAIAAGADGVHLTESSNLQPAKMSDRLIVGRSVHSLRSAENAEAEGCDYVILGTVFPSASHPGGTTVGTGLVTEVATAIGIPVIGIGGITAKNAGDVIAAGAAGVAVIGAIIGADNPYETTVELSRSVL
jgi:thiamine-phosphate diphosphorylase